MIKKKYIHSMKSTLYVFKLVYKTKYLFLEDTFTCYGKFVLVSLQILFIPDNPLNKKTEF